MNRYIIYCTGKQTRKALELGAPLKIIDNEYDERIYNFICGNTQNGKALYRIPTAEQMIGWLEEQCYFSFDIYQSRLSWYCSVIHRDKECVLFDSLDSRKESTLAALDAALEYLQNKK